MRTKAVPVKDDRFKREQDLIGKTIIGTLAAAVLTLLFFGIALVLGAFPEQADNPVMVGAILIVACTIILGYLTYLWKTS